MGGSLGFCKLSDSPFFVMCESALGEVVNTGPVYNTHSHTTPSLGEVVQVYSTHSHTTPCTHTLPHTSLLNYHTHPHNTHTLTTHTSSHHTHPHTTHTLTECLFLRYGKSIRQCPMPSPITLSTVKNLYRNLFDLGDDLLDSPDSALYVRGRGTRDWQKLEKIR